MSGREANSSRKDTGRIWFVRAGARGWAAREFVRGGFVGIGWSETGALAGVGDLRALEARLRAVFPTRSRRTITAWAAMLRALTASMEPGDVVMTVDPETRLYWVGRVTSEYRFVEADELGHRRGVAWGGALTRGGFTEQTLHSLGASSTVFRLSADASKEVLARSATMAVSGGRPDAP